MKLLKSTGPGGPNVPLSPPLDDPGDERYKLGQLQLKAYWISSKFRVFKRTAYSSFLSRTLHFFLTGFASRTSQSVMTWNSTETESKSFDYSFILFQCLFCVIN